MVSRTKYVESEHEIDLYRESQAILRKIWNCIYNLSMLCSRIKSMNLECFIALFIVINDMHLKQVSSP